MIAIHSFKSCKFKPILDAVGGAHLVKPMVQIMALSAATIRKHHDEFVLITDDLGKQMAQECEMPYSEIISVGQAFDSDPSFWIHSKIHAYHEINQPFVHYDTDLFLWEPLPEKFLASEVFAFHSETFTWRKYEIFLQNLQQAGINMPLLHKKYWTNRMPINMAVFGGNNHQAIKQYAGFILDFVQDNNGFHALNSSQRDVLEHNIAFIEQMWASYLLQNSMNIPIELLLTEVQILSNSKVEGVELTHLHGAKQTAMRENKTHELVAKLSSKLLEVNPKVSKAVEAFTAPEVDIDAMVQEASSD